MSLPPSPAPVLSVRRWPGARLDAPLDLMPGQMSALALPSRQARETMTAWLAGEQPAEPGAVTLLGCDLSEWAWRTGSGATPAVAFVPPQGGLLASLNAWENVWAPLAYHHPGRAAQLAWRFGAVMRLAGLDPQAIAPRQPDELSSLERRLVGFARALVLEPELIVVEDLFAELDAVEQVRAGQLFETFAFCLPFRALLAVGGAFPEDVLPRAVHRIRLSVE